MLSVESEDVRNLSAHIGASTVTTALLRRCSAICLAMLSTINPPQLKPITVVARKPAIAPCNRRVTDAPCRIEGNSMLFPFAELVRSGGGGDPGWVPAVGLNGA